MDWTLIAVGALTAAAAMGGQLVPVWAESRRESRSNQAHQWEAKRDAYLELLTAIKRLSSVAAGALASGRGHSEGELIHGLLSAAVKAEMLAPPSIWEDMRPLVLAVQARSNATLAGVAAAQMEAVNDRLRETNAVTETAWQEHWHRFLDAARRDLAIAKN